MRVAARDGRSGVPFGGGNDGRGWLPEAGAWMRCRAVALEGAVGRVRSNSHKSGTWRW